MEHKYWLRDANCIAEWGHFCTFEAVKPFLAAGAANKTASPSI